MLPCHCDVKSTKFNGNNTMECLSFVLLSTCELINWENARLMSGIVDYGMCCEQGAVLTTLFSVNDRITLGKELVRLLQGMNIISRQPSMVELLWHETKLYHQRHLGDEC